MKKMRCAVVIEKDPILGRKVGDCLAQRGYLVEYASGNHELAKLFDGGRISLAVLGETREGGDFVHSLDAIVRLSPMTSVILLTDLTDADVHDRAEGYGILGTASRRDPITDLDILIGRLEEIESIINRNLA
jgi:DNA-binding NtrC family response regulator